MDCQNNAHVNPARRLDASRPASSNSSILDTEAVEDYSKKREFIPSDIAVTVDSFREIE